MRTIRRVSLKLNREKWKRLVEMVHSYAQEKDAHLLFFASDAAFASCPGDRTRRDLLVHEGYRSPFDLQARQWKLALKDAIETVGKQWSQIAADLSPRIAQKKLWSDTMKRYANWLLFSPQRMAHLYVSHALVPSHFEIDLHQQRTVRNFLRRVIRRRRGRRPRVKIARSMGLDTNMYTVFFEGGTQYIKIMSLKKGKRIVIPLCGNTPISGNIRLVLDSSHQRVEIHYTAEVKGVHPPKGAPCALDAGISEVFTDEGGNRYGEGFGKMLSQASEAVNQKGKARHQLYQIAREAEEAGKWVKARRIRRFNLGNKKQHHQRRQARAELARHINTAINEVMKKRQPQVIVTEKLDIRGKAKSKKLSRRVSMWTRRILNERTEFKASAGGSRREQVNPAYSSQTCPSCWFVHKDNRQGDAFQCTHCGHADHADRVAAQNLKARLGDPQITLYTPKERVKTLLLYRFNARLESGGNSATVSGRTPGVIP
ncbi:transposase [Candidatus Poribacteria bacterium]|nr:transposase [Candidatus Poribacteria bacterium]